METSQEGLQKGRPLSYAEILSSGIPDAPDFVPLDDRMPRDSSRYHTFPRARMQQEKAFGEADVGGSAMSLENGHSKHYPMSGSLERVSERPTSHVRISPMPSDRQHEENKNSRNSKRLHFRAKKSASIPDDDHTWEHSGSNTFDDASRTSTLEKNEKLSGSYGCDLEKPAIPGLIFRSSVHRASDGAHPKKRRKKHHHRSSLKSLKDLEQKEKERQDEEQLKRMMQPPKREKKKKQDHQSQHQSASNPKRKEEEIDIQEKVPDISHAKDQTSNDAMEKPERPIRRKKSKGSKKNSEIPAKRESKELKDAMTSIKRRSSKNKPDQEKDKEPSKIERRKSSKKSRRQGATTAEYHRGMSTDIIAQYLQDIEKDDFEFVPPAPPKQDDGIKSEENAKKKKHEHQHHHQRKSQNHLEGKHKKRNENAFKDAENKVKVSTDDGVDNERVVQNVDQIDLDHCPQENEGKFLARSILKEDDAKKDEEAVRAKGDIHVHFGKENEHPSQINNETVKEEKDHEDPLSIPIPKEEPNEAIEVKEILQKKPSAQVKAYEILDDLSSAWMDVDQFGFDEEEDGKGRENPVQEKEGQLSPSLETFEVIRKPETEATQSMPNERNTPNLASHAEEQAIAGDPNGIKSVKETEVSPKTDNKAIANVEEEQITSFQEKAEEASTPIESGEGNKSKDQTEVKAYEQLDELSEAWMNAGPMVLDSEPDEDQGSKDEQVKSTSTESEKRNSPVELKIEKAEHSSKHDPNAGKAYEQLDELSEAWMDVGPMEFESEGDEDQAQDSEAVLVESMVGGHNNLKETELKEKNLEKSTKTDQDKDPVVGKAYEQLDELSEAWMDAGPMEFESDGDESERNQAKTDILQTTEELENLDTIQKETNDLISADSDTKKVKEVKAYEHLDQLSEAWMDASPMSFESENERENTGKDAHVQNNDDLCVDTKQKSNESYIRKSSNEDEARIFSDQCNLSDEEKKRSVVKGKESSGSSASSEAESQDKLKMDDEEDLKKLKKHHVLRKRKQRDLLAKAPGSEDEESTTSEKRPIEPRKPMESLPDEESETLADVEDNTEKESENREAQSQYSDSKLSSDATRSPDNESKLLENLEEMSCERHWLKYADVGQAEATWAKQMQKKSFLQSENRESNKKESVNSSCDGDELKSALKSPEPGPKMLQEQEDESKGTEAPEKSSGSSKQNEASVKAGTQGGQTDPSCYVIQESQGGQPAGNEKPQNVTERNEETGKPEPNRTLSLEEGNAILSGTSENPNAPVAHVVKSTNLSAFEHIQNYLIDDNDIWLDWWDLRQAEKIFYQEISSQSNHGEEEVSKDRSELEGDGSEEKKKHGPDGGFSTSKDDLVYLLAMADLEPQVNVRIEMYKILQAFVSKNPTALDEMDEIWLKNRIETSLSNDEKIAQKKGAMVQELNDLLFILEVRLTMIQSTAKALERLKLVPALKAMANQQALELVDRTLSDCELKEKISRIKESDIAKDFIEHIENFFLYLQTLRNSFA